MPLMLAAAARLPSIEPPRSRDETDRALSEQHDQHSPRDQQSASNSTDELEAQVESLLAQIAEHAPDAADPDSASASNGNTAREEAGAPEQSAAPEDASSDEASADDAGANVASVAQEQVDETPAAQQLENDLNAVAQQIDAASEALADDDAPASVDGDPAEAAATESTPDSDDATGDELAQQIQALLDEAQAEAEGETEADGEAESDASAEPEHNTDASAATEDNTETEPCDARADDVVGGAENEEVPAGPSEAETAEGDTGDMSETEALSGIFDAAETIISQEEGAASTDTAEADDAASAPQMTDAPPTESAAEAAPQATAQTEAAAPAAADDTPQDTDDNADEDDPALISRIDQMLAEQAEEAIGGDFESVDDVLDTNVDISVAMGAPQTDETDPSAEAEEAADTDNAAAATEAAAHEQGEADDDAELDGSFEAPQDVSDDDGGASEPAAQASTDDAQAVADELDNQPETAAASEPAPAAPTTPAASTEDVTDETTAASAGIDYREKLAQLAVGVRFTYSLVNRPLDRLSPELRSTVGWVGAITFFNAACLLVYGLFN